MRLSVALRWIDRSIDRDRGARVWAASPPYTPGEGARAQRQSAALHSACLPLATGRDGRSCWLQAARAHDCHLAPRRQRGAGGRWQASPRRARPRRHCGARVLFCRRALVPLGHCTGKHSLLVRACVRASVRTLLISLPTFPLRAMYSLATGTPRAASPKAAADAAAQSASARRVAPSPTRHAHSSAGASGRAKRASSCARRAAGRSGGAWEAAIATEGWAGRAGQRAQPLRPACTRAAHRRSNTPRHPGLYVCMYVCMYVCHTAFPPARPLALALPQPVECARRVIYV